MVQSKGGSSRGSSSREFGITFEIEPPAAVRPGTPFTLPVIVAVRPVGNLVNPAVQHMVAHASLRSETGTAAATGLAGTLTSSVRSRNGNTTSGFAKFSPLSIAQPGRYRIRVILGAASHSGVTIKEYVDSGVIHVHAGAEAVQRPTDLQISKLQAMTAENIDITPADIAAWQRPA
ncbi:hypothetical protein LV164_001636 [Aspergillus fumigatus]|uniref:Velvet domain-containing protein n=1 Tax=Aspergillus fumigatus TaxID=746128 RepID=A0A9P8NQ37_ASPFM|nr:hypothetical protein KXX42_007925 [Aspergillus fumigatus]KAH1546073.1 hypothetical protein KXX57_004047 [Aspergillus fumigatus]KAH1910704.1 hypothetical protein KXV57_007523 [Aspergillus fumigatus]KAH1980533.1 hypothetical protein KXW88_006615 [Aspergillus fumigatus]KAH2306804.1 hypothetical protein KXV47_007570 [Aspergillus fumigatus]